MPTLTVHNFGGVGFTYGGLIGGVVAAVVIIHRHRLPLGVVAGAAVPLTLAYGIGRLGCLLSGDGTYGRPNCPTQPACTGTASPYETTWTAYPA